MEILIREDEIKENVTEKKTVLHRGVEGYGEMGDWIKYQISRWSKFPKQVEQTLSPDKTFFRTYKNKSICRG